MLIHIYNCRPWASCCQLFFTLLYVSSSFSLKGSCNILWQSPGQKTMLITDGAPCYPSLSHKFGWRHEACNHSKGVFCIKKRIRKKHVLIHTGGVDAMWRLSKSAIPCSLSTRTNHHVNPNLMRSIRVWQWRWMNSKTKSLLEVTGRSLKKRMAMWEGKTSRTFWRTNSL